MHFSYNKRVVVSLLRLFTVSVLKFKIRASPFESSPRTLPPQLTRSRHPHGTQELLLRAAPQRDNPQFDITPAIADCWFRVPLPPRLLGDLSIAYNNLHCQEFTGNLSPFPVFSSFSFLLTPGKNQTTSSSTLPPKRLFQSPPDG